MAPVKYGTGRAGNILIFWMQVPDPPGNSGSKNITRTLGCEGLSKACSLTCSKTMQDAKKAPIDDPRECCCAPFACHLPENTEPLGYMQAGHVTKHKYHPS